MRVILMAAGLAALAACGSGGNTDSADNALTADNMLLDTNMVLDPAMNLDGNGAVDGETQNMIATDMNTNDPDTHLANGL